MENKNIVFIAQSLDGFIAGKNGELDWLTAIPNPENIEMGFERLMDEIDAIVMGRNTFETVCSFDGPWLYSKHVFVLSNSLHYIPENLKGKASLLKGTPGEVLDILHRKNHHVLYIDGGKTIQNFLEVDLIDELRITTLPILLGEGIPLFNDLTRQIKFKHVKTEVFLDALVQSHYSR